MTDKRRPAGVISAHRLLGIPSGPQRRVTGSERRGIFLVSVLAIDLIYLETCTDLPLQV